MQMLSFNPKRMPTLLQSQLSPILKPTIESNIAFLSVNSIYHGDAREFLPRINPNSIAVSVWSPPYFVGKGYESYLDFNGWRSLLECIIRLHFPIIQPGGFLVINMADILCFQDPSIPKIQADTVRRRCSITREQVLEAMAANPKFNRYQIANLLGCSEQTIDRRLHGNNIRGGKYNNQTRVKVVGGLVEEWGSKAGFYLYDRRIWVKDPCWANSRWHSLSYRSVDEFEYLYVFWKPGVTKFDRNRLSPTEWRRWGSRGVWCIPSVRANDDHEAKYPIELARRIIRLFSEKDEVILDPFVGSGTTAVAAVQECRKYIGIDLEEKYVALANRRLSCMQQAFCVD
jgi:DNA modification methylase